jgi:D-sedoheptulose 7-phosphate isomerase
VKDRLRELAEEHETVAAEFRTSLLGEVEAIGRTICDALGAGGRVLVFGNGGSAADAQHLAAELLGRYRRERAPLAAVALTTDSSTLTAIGNDYEFAEVFARQVRALARPGDVIVGISTSGEAENVVRGLAAGNESGASTVALTGSDGGRLAGLAAQSIVVPSRSTARVQEMHVLSIHLICELVDDWAASRESGAR